MGIAVGISLAFHLVAVPVVFSQLDKLAPGIYNRIFEDTPLDVILVNASTDEEAPTDAQAIAAMSSMSAAMSISLTLSRR